MKKTTHSKKHEKKSDLSIVKGKTKMETMPAAYASSDASYFRVRSTPSKRCKNAITVEGKDFLGTIAIPASGDGPGYCLKNIFIQPQELGLTRLEKFSELYEKYLMKKIKFKWVPAVGTNTVGTVMLAYDRDIDDATPLAGEQALRQYMSYDGSKAESVFKGFEIVCPLEAPETGFYTNAASADDRFSYQGQLYVVTVVPAIVGGSQVLGSLWIEYEMELFVPQLESANEAFNKYTSTSGVLPQTSDALNTFLSTPAAAAANNVPYQIRNTTGKYEALLPEGLYELTEAFLQGTTGSVVPANPVLTAVQNAPATAPQPYIRQILSTSASAIGGYATYQALLNVPKGGAWLAQTLSIASGITSGSGHQMWLKGIGPATTKAYVDSLFT